MAANAVPRCRNCKEVTRFLKGLSGAVTEALNALDAEMKQPSSRERGQRVAAICNQLDGANDAVRYFALGVNFRTDKKGVR